MGDSKDDSEHLEKISDFKTYAKVEQNATEINNLNNLILITHF